MTTHVFIVNKHTFPIHLQYLFVGTGAKNKDEDIGLLSDIKRVRPGDKVIFYLETSPKDKIEGGFYGIFKIKESQPIVFHEYGNQTYLIDQLHKKLIYRVLIEPEVVYAEGVKEWEALDNLPIYSQEILWSLIYRKLKGKRGCTPITMEESDRLVNLIKIANNNHSLPFTNNDGFTWNIQTQKIEVRNGERILYSGNRNPPPDILQQLIILFNNKKSFETHLQAYFTENIGIDPHLDQICGDKNKIIWIGNEVACGVGMQKIDVFTITKDERNNKEFRIIEIKDETIKPDIVRQIFRYVNWVSQYIKGANNSNIQPIVVALKINRKFKNDGTPTKRWQRISNAFTDFNDKNIAKDIKYFEYEFQNNTIIFSQVYY